MELVSMDYPELRVVPVANGLANPFDFAFRNNEDIVISERYTGKLRVVKNGALQAVSIDGCTGSLLGGFSRRSHVSAVSSSK